ncbi:hypothetical protein [Bradyrhizobium sp. SZCCHNR3015]|nr:hypothetical protein [Bradyrhizobium sp. SZCCHNR3015]
MACPGERRQVIVVECHTASRGRMSVRLFDPAHGEPAVLPDGRLVMVE